MREGPYSETLVSVKIPKLIQYKALLNMFAVFFVNMTWPK